MMIFYSFNMLAQRLNAWHVEWRYSFIIVDITVHTYSSATYSLPDVLEIRKEEIEDPKQPIEFS